jgi:hypothetical protein
VTKDYIVIVRQLFVDSKKLNRKIAKLSTSITVGITTMIIVYIALQVSTKVPSLSRIPIMSDTAVSIVRNEDRDAESHNSNDFATRFVYIKGNGSIFKADPNSNSIGEYLGSAGETTITTGNHFAWEVMDKKDSLLYYVDSITGEIIVKSNLSKLSS